MTATIRHFLPLMVIMGLLAVSMTLVRLLLAALARPFRRPDARKPPVGPGPVIDGTFIDLTPGVGPKTGAPDPGAPVPPRAPGR